MATPKTIQSTVAFTDPQNNVLANGILTLDLSQPAIVTGGGQVAPLRVAITLTAGGLIPASTTIWANDQLTPSGTTYHARLFTSNNMLAADLGLWSIAGISPIDVSGITPSLAAGGVAISFGSISPTTTKGDMIARSTTIDSRLGVGADGQLLTADSTQTLGVKWAAGISLSGDAVFKSGIPSYDVKAFGATCNGVADDSTAINAAVTAAAATGGVVNFDNCVWSPPAILPAPSFWVILRIRNKLTITATLNVRALYKIDSTGGQGGLNPVFLLQPTGSIVPSPASLSPVIKFVTVAGGTNPMAMENIVVTGFTGTGITTDGTTPAIQLTNVVSDSNSNLATCFPLVLVGGFGHRIVGGSYKCGPTSVNPSILLQNNATTVDPIRDVLISGGQKYLTLNYQGIKINSTGAAAFGDCSRGIIIDQVLYENSNGAGSKDFLTLDTANNCIAGIQINRPYIADNIGAAPFVVNTGTGANTITNVSINDPMASHVLLTGTRPINGFFVRTPFAGTAANIGTTPFCGTITDGSGFSYIGAGGACASSVAGIFSGLNADLDVSSTWTVMSDSGNAVANSMTFRARTGQTGKIARFCNQALTSCATVDINAKHTFAASTVTAASLNIPAGTAPTTPVAGDIWGTTTGIQAQYNALTHTLVDLDSAQALSSKSTSAGPLAGIVASGTAVMTTAAITGPNCGTTVTVAATSVFTTDTITFSDNAAPAATTNGPLVIKAWPTTGNVNFAYCVQSGTFTPAAATLNWRVVR